MQLFDHNPVSALVSVRYLHGYNDPTAFPYPWNQPERSLFKTIEKFRFADGQSFDFRGEEDRTLHFRRRTLANSNQRIGKGFVPTYHFDRDWKGLTGRFKLDWIFVKPFVEDPRNAGQSQLFAPEFPVTMRALNQPGGMRISDHAPMVVDLSPIEQKGYIASPRSAQAQ